MARESVEEKGRRYVLEGRLTVVAVDETIVRASCRGSGAVWEIEFDGESWSCSCPASRGCSHLVATQLVTVRAGAGPDGECGCRPGWRHEPGCPEVVGGDAYPEPVVDREPFVTRPASSGAAVEDEDDEDPEPHVGGTRSSGAAYEGDDDEPAVGL